MQIEELVSAQRAFFNTGATKDAAFRRRALAALRQAVTAREADICAALKDFSQYLDIQTVRKGRQIQRHLRFSSHGVYVA